MEQLSYCIATIVVLDSKLRHWRPSIIASVSLILSASLARFLLTISPSGLVEFSESTSLLLKQVTDLLTQRLFPFFTIEDQLSFQKCLSGACRWVLIQAPPMYTQFEVVKGLIESTIAKDLLEQAMTCP